MINDDRGAGEGVYRDGGDRFIDAQQDDCDVSKVQQMDHAGMPEERSKAMSAQVGGRSAKLVPGCMVLEWHGSAIFADSSCARALFDTIEGENMRGNVGFNWILA